MTKEKGPAEREPSLAEDHGLVTLDKVFSDALPTG